MRKAVDINSQLPTTDVHEGGTGHDRSAVPLKTSPPHPGARRPAIKARRASWLAVRAEPEPTTYADEDTHDAGVVDNVVALDDTTPPAGGAVQTSSAPDVEADESLDWGVDHADLGHPDSADSETAPFETGDPETGYPETGDADAGYPEPSESDDRGSRFAEGVQAEHAEDADVLGDVDERSAEPSTAPIVLELRQIAGLTAGEACELQPSASYEFSESLSGHGFRVEVDGDSRVEFVRDPDDAGPGRTPMQGPLPIGSGVLDVGNARFVVWARRSRRRASDWSAVEALSVEPEPTIFVPEDLVGPDTAPVEAARSRRRRPWSRKKSRKKQAPQPTEPVLEDASWDFIDEVRVVRDAVVQRQRYHYPDPAEIADRAHDRAPMLGQRHHGHPLFGKVGSLVADMPWMPRFDRLDDIPVSLGRHLRPLMVLPSVPISSNLTDGPLGIVGGRAATLSCARYLMLSLFGASTAELRLHLATDEPAYWRWSGAIVAPGDIYPHGGFPVLVADGKRPLAEAGVDPRDAIEGRLGLIACVDDISDLPPYCANVLQLRPDGTGLLTNQHGDIIAGTPVGMSERMADAVASDLHASMVQRDL